MLFEFDEHKSRTNKAKHGVDFNEIQALWEDELRMEIPARTVDEPRTIVIGMYDGKLWSCVITERGRAIRIITARRARREEADIYES